MKTKTVATHDGKFHTDEVFAIAILRLIYPDIKIIRSRKPEDYSDCDLKVDICRNCDPEKGEFDHHQEDFNKSRENKIPYASAGLVWKHFGMKLVNSKEAFDYIDEKLMQPIDAMDCGVDITPNCLIRNYCIGQVIESFKPSWQDKNRDYNKGFEKAVNFATDLLSKEIKYANGIIKAEEIIKAAISNSNNPDYIILEDNIPFQKYLIENTNIKYVIQKNSAGYYSVYTVRVSLTSFENRKDLPKRWAGLQGTDLVKTCGVDDALFCHKNLFNCVAKSKEGAIKLVELALKEKE